MASREKQNLAGSLVRMSLVLVVTALLVPLTAQAAETTNRLSGNRLAGNRLAGNRLAENRLAGNRLSGNRLAGNQLSPNRLEANLDTAEILTTADGREVYSYMVSCALPEGMTIEATVPGAPDTAPPDTAPPDTLYTCKDDHCVFSGSLGLAEHWIDRRLDTKGQRWVTACLLARVNHFGVKQIISLRGVAPQLSVSPDGAQMYSLQEGVKNRSSTHDSLRTRSKKTDVRFCTECDVSW